MRITARYGSTCGVCGKPIARGEVIDWERGRAASHAACTGQTAGEHTIERRQRRPRFDSDHGRDYGYDVNPKGRCEDAPCCGCCS